jgi:hypothetical protein
VRAAYSPVPSGHCRQAPPESHALAPIGFVTQLSGLTLHAARLGFAL